MSKLDLIYITSVPMYESSGVREKTDNQIDAFKARQKKVLVIRPENRGWKRLLLPIKFIWNAVNMNLNGVPVYIRYDVFTAPLIILARMLSLHIIVEINGNLQAEVLAGGSVWKLPIQMIADFLSLRCPDICVVPCHDVGEKYMQLVKRIEVVPNVMNTTCITYDFTMPSVERFPDKFKDTYGFTFLYIGTLTRAHGLDRFIENMAFPQLSKSKLLVIGDGPERKNIENLCRELGVTHQVSFFGWRNKEELPLFASQSHVGLGPLAIERVGLFNASPLKVREYLSFGLPVIIGYEEDPLIGSKRFVKQIVPTSKEIVQDIVEFVENSVVPGGTLLRQDISEFATENLSYASWAQKIVDLFTGLEVGSV